MSKLLCFFLSCAFALAQTPGNAGTLEVTVADPSGASVAAASVVLSNPLTQYRQTATTDGSGQARLFNLPYNVYSLEVISSGFITFHLSVEVRTAAPRQVRAVLALAGARTTIDVAADPVPVENVSSMHVDLGRALMNRLPANSPASGLSDVLMLAAPGVVADSNGFFHPLGDHAQTSFIVDGQPINDQQSKTFSTQLPLNAIEAVEAVTGAPGAEFGDKTSLVVVTTTRSALGQSGTHGSLASHYASFGSPGLEATLGAGNQRMGNFLAVSGLRTGRFLDTPEYRPIHAIGNSQTVFNRFDFRANQKQAFHVKALALRNWFQVPNTLDQPQQDQRQRATTANLGVGWIYTPAADTLISVNPFIRQDRLDYWPSGEAEFDTPVTLGQNRRLTNWGTRADATLVRGVHDIKFGFQGMQTRLSEKFFFGVTDPDYAAELPGLAPYDLTNGGRLFRFAGTANINQAALYLQDSIRWRGLNLSLGFRYDRYRGLTNDTGLQPRAGISYQIRATGTVLRAAYSRTFETPYNENLILASSTGTGGLALNAFGADAVEPIRPGQRNQYNAGLQQAFGRHVVFEGDAYWKYTRNAYDFGALLTTPLVFPISWYKSSLSGFSARFSTVELRGLQAYWLMGHSKARFFRPSTGGLIYTGDLEPGVFRIDHDQAFQSTVHARYGLKRLGWYAAWTWRYDSGLVSGEIANFEDAIALTPAQQSAIGLYCGNTFATPAQGLTGCGENESRGAVRYRMPFDAANDDHRPSRVAPRHLHNLTAGTDNLLRGDAGLRLSLRLSVTNLTGRQALYNFLSPFGGTHFVAPRMWQAALGIHF